MNWARKEMKYFSLCVWFAYCIQDANPLCYLGFKEQTVHNSWSHTTNRPYIYCSFVIILEPALVLTKQEFILSVCCYFCSGHTLHICLLWYLQTKNLFVMLNNIGASCGNQTSFPMLCTPTQCEREDPLRGDFGHTQGSQAVFGRWQTQSLQQCCL